jgi:hypothetical protein
MKVHAKPQRTQSFLVAVIGATANSAQSLQKLFRGSPKESSRSLRLCVLDYWARLYINFAPNRVVVLGNEFDT